MTNSDTALQIFAEKYRWLIHPVFGTPVDKKDELLSDLTALISEHYVAKEAAGYPLEFVEWLIKDQEIFFGELNEEYILNDNIHVGGRKLQTIDELFNYWKENER